MSNFNFLTMGDKNFFEPIKISINQINKFYPDHKIIIYDWGFSNNQRHDLEKFPNTQIIDWKIKNNKIIIINNWIKTILSNKIFTVSLRRLTRPIRNINKENLLLNKIFCFEHYINNFGNNFIFLDGDAFIINKFDELFNIDFDIGITLRRKDKIKLYFGECAALNTGVIFFLGGLVKNKNFIESWKKEALDTGEHLIEQTSLSRLMLKNSPNSFDNYNKNIILRSDDEEELKIRILPCDIYNFTYVSRFNPLRDNDVKILHFNDRNFESPIFKEILKTFFS